jgi:hypothetical protein
VGSRTLPTECEHGRTVDWGEFGPDLDDGSVGAEPCPECEAEVPDCVHCDLTEALALLADLVDDDPCSFDHHGHCQTHGWTGDDPCPYPRARQLLARRGQP